MDAEPVAKFPLPVFKKMKTLIRRTIACASLMLLLGPMQSNGAGLPLALDGQTLPSLAPMLEDVLPSVVNISTEGRVSIGGSPFQSDPFFERFFNRRPELAADIVANLSIDFDPDLFYQLVFLGHEAT